MNNIDKAFNGLTDKIQSLTEAERERYNEKVHPVILVTVFGIAVSLN